MSGPKVQKGGCTRKHAFFAFFTFFDVFSCFLIFFIIYLSLIYRFIWIDSDLKIKVPSMNKYLFIRLRVQFLLRPILTDFVVFWRFLGPPQKPPKSEKGVEFSSRPYGAFLTFLRNTDETGVFRRFLEKGRFLTFFDDFWGFWRTLGFSIKFEWFHNYLWY